MILQKIAILRTYAEETLNPAREEPHQGAIEPADTKPESDDELRIDNESADATSPDEAQTIEKVTPSAQSTETAKVSARRQSDA